MFTGMAEKAADRHISTSLGLYQRARSSFPSGVSRSTIEKNPGPIYIKSGAGAYVTDVEDRRYLDLNNNYTTLLHGHAFEPVVRAVCELIGSGSCFANPTEHEIALAELLIGRIPAVERIRFVNTGTEAAMFAIKAARAFTGRSAIARFEGAYHGAFDVAETGQNCEEDAPAPGLRKAKVPYRGAPAHLLDDVVVMDFNNASDVERIIANNSARLAAVLIDPMPSRAGLIAPSREFIAALNASARKHGVLIIADEVLNFRQDFCGASYRYGLQPDIVTLGKIIGGGFPIGAIGGREDVMEMFSNDRGPPIVSQGGTFSANPVSMVAGLTAMEHMQTADFDRLERMGDQLRARLHELAQAAGSDYAISGSASLFRIHPQKVAPSTYRQSRTAETQRLTMRRMTSHFRKHGILLPFEAAACLSTAIVDEDMESICNAFSSFLDAQPTTN